MCWDTIWDEVFGSYCIMAHTVTGCYLLLSQWGEWGTQLHLSVSKLLCLSWAFGECPCSPSLDELSLQGGLSNRKNIMQSDNGKKEIHQAFTYTPPNFSLTPFHALPLPIVLFLHFSGKSSHEPKQHSGRCQLQATAKNSPYLKSGALEDPIVPDNLAVEAEVARSMYKC